MKPSENKIAKNSSVFPYIPAFFAPRNDSSGFKGVCVSVCVMIIAVVSRRQTLSVLSAADFISLREVRSGKELSYKSVFHFVV